MPIGPPLGSTHGGTGGYSQGTGEYSQGTGEYSQGTGEYSLVPNGTPLGSIKEVLVSNHGVLVSTERY